MNVDKFPPKTSRVLAAVALAVGLVAGAGSATAAPKCTAEAGECARQDQQKKKAHGYPGCLSTKGGDGCRFQTPDPKLPPKQDVTPVLPDGDGSGGSGSAGGNTRQRSSTGR